MGLSDIGSERAVLGGIARFGQDGLLEVSDIINSETFTVQRNQALYQIMQSVLAENKTVDLGSLAIYAERLFFKHFFQEERDLEFISSLFKFDISVDNVRGYAKRIAKLEIARKAQDKHKEAYENLKNLDGSESLTEILALSEKPVFDLVSELNDQQDNNPETVGTDIDQFLTHLMENEGNMVGLPTPWSHFNHAVGGGMRNGGVTLIGARMKIGKSQIAKEIGLFLAKEHQIPVLFLDTEMDKTDLITRCLAGLSMVPLDELESGNFQYGNKKHLVTQAAETLKNLPFFHQSVAGKSFDEILSIVRRWVLKHVGFDEHGNTNSCLVVYDYFKLMDIGDLDNMPEYQAIGYQISKLTDFCKEYKFPCLAFVQLNRDGISKEDSSVISQSDRLLWLCHSFSIFKGKTMEEMQEDGPEFGNRKLVVICTRYGGGMQEGNFINMNMKGELATIQEIGTRADMLKHKALGGNGGFESKTRSQEDSNPTYL